jgi:ABC-2 type transport system ATP-binding protein
MYCVETDHLTYRFARNEPVVRNVHLQVPQGSIYGFLGQNGAGKTTTLRLILGLLKKQQGIITIFGKSFEEHRLQILREIGSLIESPSLYGHLTAVENLTIYQKIYQAPKNRIQEVLELVGLSGTGKKKAGQFSLGMKQRLGLAIALINKPSLLILDEPTNGLDPNGIIEMRELLKQLQREQGITILISSHLLAEIEKLVTHVGIINQGQLIFQGTLPELMSRREQSAGIVLETDDARRTMGVLEQLHLTGQVESTHVVLPFVQKEIVANIARELVRNDIAIYGIQQRTDDLETIFMNAIK